MLNSIVFDGGGRAVLKASTPWYKDLFSKEIERRGVHAYISIPRIWLEYYFIFEAEIPPFTPYWIGEDNEIAASNLIIYDKRVRQ